MNKLALLFGLCVAVPLSNFSADAWESVREREQQRLKATLYPDPADAAAQVIAWLNTGKIVITGENAEKRVQYGDRRGVV